MQGKDFGMFFRLQNNRFEICSQKRTVSLYEWSEKGFIFCSNYEGDKAMQLQQNPKAAICFQWEKINKQVRVCGTVTRVSAKETEELFRSVQRDSQIVFWATSEGKDHPYNQSNVMFNSREERIEYMDGKLEQYRFF